MFVSARTGIVRKQLLAVLAVMGGLSGKARALDASGVLLFSREPLTIKPQLDIAHVYNDNFSSTATNPQKDLITTISPGFELLVGRRSANHLVFTYGLSQHVYADRTDLNSVEHTIALATVIDQDRWSLTGADSIRFLTSPIGNYNLVDEIPTGDRPLTGLGQNIQRTTISDRYAFTYRLDQKTAAYAEISHNGQDYERGTPLFDVTTIAGTLGAAYVASPKITISADGYYGVSSSSRNIAGPTFSDLTFAGGTIGARGTFTPKVTGNVRVGYETRAFEDGSGDSAAPVAIVGLNYQYSAKRSFSLNYARRQDVSIQFDQQSYASDSVNLQLSQKIGTSGKWSARLGGYYTLYNYDATLTSPERSYEVYSLNFSVAYQIQLWLNASLGFDRTSILAESAGSSSYDVNRVTLSLSVGY